MGLRTGDANSFFAPTSEQAEILAERGRCLDESPADYAMLIDSGGPLLAEIQQFAASAGALDRATDYPLEALGRRLEPDFVLLAPSLNGPIVAGCVRYSKLVGVVPR